MAPLRARTRDEAQLYLSLVPCACGAADFERDVDVLSPRPRVLSFSGTCPRCGRARTSAFEVLEPFAPEPDRPRQYAFGPGDTPSSLIDAGQWLVISQLLTEQVQALAGAVSDPADVAAGHELVQMAAAAVDEVLKFLPPEAVAVPDEAFWTEHGRALRAALPEWFDRDRLLGLQLERWRAVTGYDEAYDIDEVDDEDEVRAAFS
jgi:hypothetical protein